MYELVLIQTIFYKIVSFYINNIIVIYIYSDIITSLIRNQ